MLQSGPAMTSLELAERAGKSPEKRLKDLQTGADALLEIAYQTPEVLAPKEVERILHDKFAERRAVGEWFNVTLDDIQPELLSLPLEIA